MQQKMRRPKRSEDALMMRPSDIIFIQTLSNILCEERGNGYEKIREFMVGYDRSIDTGMCYGDSRMR